MAAGEIKRTSSSRSRGSSNKTRLPVVFIGPGLLVLAVLALVPTLFAIGISLQDRELGQADSGWVWFANYIQLFSDRRFINSVGVSLTWEVVTVSATMVLAVLLGVLLFQCTTARWRNLLCMLFIVPVLLPRVSAAFVWKFAFHPLFGLLTWPYKAITGEPLDLLANPLTALLTVAFVDVWQWGLVLRGHRAEAARNIATATVRSRANGPRKDLGGLRLRGAADAEGPADQPDVREDGRVAAGLRPDLRDDARRAGHLDRDAGHVRLFAGVHRVGPDLVRIEHGGADDGRFDCGVHVYLEVDAMTACFSVCRVVVGVRRSGRAHAAGVRSEANVPRFAPPDIVLLAPVALKGARSVDPVLLLGPSSPQ
jgi:hypothetical protein